jgi:glycosyltransferase involved in cell wall biosynthesis
MPGCAEVIRDGWNGFLVPPGAPRMLAAKILDLLGNRENGRAMAGRATERVRKEFSLENVVACQAALYRDLIDRSGGSRFKDDRNTFEQRGHTCGAL